LENHKNILRERLGIIDLLSKNNERYYLGNTSQNDLPRATLNLNNCKPDNLCGLKLTKHSTFSWSYRFKK